MRLDDDVEELVVIKPGDNGKAKIKRFNRELSVSPARGDDEDPPKLFVLVRDFGGDVRAARLHRNDEDGRKKQSKRLKPIERIVRKLMRRQSAFANSYLQLHEMSNHRKKNGWVRDLSRNVMKSVRRSKS
jgi:hypothetical protein